MEQKEQKILKGRNLKWYWSLIEKMAGKVIDSHQLAALIDETEEQESKSTPDMPVTNRSRLREGLKIVLGDRLEIVEDSSIPARGRQKGFMVSISLRDGETINSIQGELKENFEKFARTPFKRNPKPEEVKKENKPSSTVNFPIPSAPIPGTERLSDFIHQKQQRPTQMAEVLYVWKLLTGLKKKGKTILSFPVPSPFGDNPLASHEIVDWFRSLLKVGIKINYEIRKSIKTGKETMKVLNLDEALKKLYAYGKKYGMKINSEEAGLVSVSPDPAAFNTSADLTESERHIVWVISGILEEFSPKPLDIFTISKISHERFGLEIIKPDVENVVKKAPELFLNYKTGLVSFNREATPSDPDKRWETIKEKYSPENVKREVLARIAMSHIELLNYFPGSEVVSPISETEAIYNIKFTASERDKLKLLTLVLGFRGTDMLLDPALEQTLKKELLPAVIQTLEDGNPLLRMEAW